MDDCYKVKPMMVASRSSTLTMQTLQYLAKEVLKRGRLMYTVAFNIEKEHDAYFLLIRLAEQKLTFEKCLEATEKQHLSCNIWH